MTEHEDAADNKAAPRRKLGKGLGALLGEARREEPVFRLNPRASQEGDDSASAAPRDGLANLAVGAIEPHPDQPRRRFDADSLDELAQSIAARGVIQPVIVRPLRVIPARLPVHSPRDRRERLRQDPDAPPRRGDLLRVRRDDAPP